MFLPLTVLGVFPDTLTACSFPQTIGEMHAVVVSVEVPYVKVMDDIDSPAYALTSSVDVHEDLEKHGLTPTRMQLPHLLTSFLREVGHMKKNGVAGTGDTEGGAP